MSIIDQNIVSSFPERCHPETSSFHTPFGEMCWNKIKLVQGELMVEVVILVVERLIEEDDENREIRKIEMRILNGII